MRYMNKENYEKWRIKGRIYYKIGEDPVSPEDKCIASEIWRIKNVAGEQFRMIIRSGKHSTYTLYNSKDTMVFRTRSIAKVD